MIGLFLGRRRRVVSAWALLAVVPGLAACSGGAGYPSLALRPAERSGMSGLVREGACPPGKGGEGTCEPRRATGRAPVVSAGPAGEPVADAIKGGGARDGGAGAVPGLVAAAQAAHARFEGLRAGAAAAVAAADGAALAGDAWLRANQALVELDRARAESGAALVELDRITIEDRLAHALDDPDGTGDRPGAQVIRDGAAAVSGWVSAEDSVLAELKQRFAGNRK